MSVSGLVGCGVLLVALLQGGLAPLEACSQGSRTSGECLNITSTVDSGAVTLGATQSTPGSPGGATTTGGGTPGPSAPWTPPPVRNPVLGSAQCTVILAGSCRGQSPPKNPPSAQSSDVLRPTPPSSVSDLASFAPQVPGIVIEPGGWSLPRLTTNIYATAGIHSRRGELLGWPIEVRFSPQTYHWSYGDGARSSRGVAGGSWGAAQFSATSTGHVYRAPGRYSITLQVDYAVSYRFDDGAFVPVAGTVSAGSGPVELTVLRVTPVLVDRGCGGQSLVGGRCE